MIYSIERGISLTSLFRCKITHRLYDAQQKYLVPRRIACRCTTVIRIGMGWHGGCDDSGLFFGRKRCVDKVIARIAGAHLVVRRAIAVQPRTNRALFPGNRNTRRVVSSLIEYFVADDEKMTIAIDVEHAPFDRFRTVRGVVVLFVVAKRNDVTDRRLNAISGITRISRRTGYTASGTIQWGVIRRHGLGITGNRGS